MGKEKVIDGTTFRKCIKQSDKDRKSLMREWYKFKRRYKIKNESDT